MRQGWQRDGWRRGPLVGAKEAVGFLRAEATSFAPPAAPVATPAAGTQPCPGDVWTGADGEVGSVLTVGRSRLFSLLPWPAPRAALAPLPCPGVPSSNKLLNNSATGGAGGRRRRHTRFRSNSYPAQHFGRHPGKRVLFPPLALCSHK